ncbi:hypothetical protein [Paenibacillus soyae]|uniref:Uncharacterized protein n=1 Tax=Paenibacillus soyae TaxID=2969249 RepID=A0A9X2MVV4_9BACL|nr:hypothetical protein [Paenibacillus soyae]MCR2807420.1 hypothetical protein [Paenibacillus soyae]
MIQILQWLFLFLPWLTLFAARRGAVRRYMPTVVFTSLLITIVSVMGYEFNWWRIHEQIVPWGDIVDISFVYGLLPVGTFWIFYFTADRFLLYMLVNIAVDAVFSFAIIPLMDRFGITTLERMAAWQTFVLDMIIMLLLYAYYRWQTASVDTMGTIDRPSFSGGSRDWGVRSRRGAR